jgi:hypothetical protein
LGEQNLAGFSEGKMRLEEGSVWILFASCTRWTKSEFMTARPKPGFGAILA